MPYCHPLWHTYKHWLHPWQAYLYCPYVSFILRSHFVLQGGTFIRYAHFIIRIHLVASDAWSSCMYIFRLYASMTYFSNGAISKRWTLIACHGNARFNQISLDMYKKLYMIILAIIVFCLFVCLFVFFKFEDHLTWSLIFRQSTLCGISHWLSVRLHYLPC